MRKRVLALSFVLVGSSIATILACGACGSSSNNSNQSGDGGGHMDGGGTMDSSSESSPGTDSGDAGYTTLQFDPSGMGTPDAIYWDNTKQILYIVDDVNNQVWTYTDASGFQKYAN